MNQCPICKSDQVVPGGQSVIEPEGAPAITFTPGGLRRGQFRTTNSIPCLSMACLNCGFVWSQIPPAQLAAFLRKHGTKETISRFRLDS
jgi:hypothetical protein